MKDKKNKLEEDDVQFLVDLLLETNLSISAISRQLNVSVNEVNKKINRPKVETKMTPMHVQSIFIYIYLKIHGSQK